MTKVQWNSVYTLRCTLNDGQSCKAGISKDLNASYTFDPAKKITTIEHIINMAEAKIIQINFYHKEERLVRMAIYSDDEVKVWGGRREVFEIA